MNFTQNPIERGGAGHPTELGHTSEISLISLLEGEPRQYLRASKEKGRRMKAAQVWEECPDCRDERAYLIRALGHVPF
jgi:hypothetical protein